MVVQEYWSQTLTHVPRNIVSEHAQKYVRSNAFLEPMIAKWSTLARRASEKERGWHNRRRHLWQLGVRWRVNVRSLSLALRASVFRHFAPFG